MPALTKNSRFFPCELRKDNPGGNGDKTKIQLATRFSPIVAKKN